MAIESPAFPIFSFVETSPCHSAQTRLVMVATCFMIFMTVLSGTLMADDCDDTDFYNSTRMLKTRFLTTENPLANSSNVRAKDHIQARSSNEMVSTVELVGWRARL